MKRKVPKIQVPFVEAAICFGQMQHTMQSAAQSIAESMRPFFETVEVDIPDNLVQNKTEHTEKNETITEYFALYVPHCRGIESATEAVCIGELTDKQFAVFKKLSKSILRQKGIYLDVEFISRQDIPPNSEDDLLLNTLLRKKSVTGLEECIVIADLVRGDSGGESLTVKSIASASVDASRYAQAASGKGNPKSAIPVMTAAELAYNESIEWADEPADVTVKNPEAISNPVVEIIGELITVVKEPKPFYQVKPPRDTSFEPAKKTEQAKKPLPALSELIETKKFIKTITPLPKYDNPNSKWITSVDTATKLGISEGRLSNLRVKNDCVDYKEAEYAGFVIGRSENGLIWCKSSQTSKTIFYLFSEVRKRMQKKK